MKDGQVKITTPIKRQHWEHCHENVVIGKRLGEGAFAEVLSGRLKTKAFSKSNRLKKSNRSAQTGKQPQSKTRSTVETVEVPVAIKMAKMDSITKEQIMEIISEARLMRRLSHPNIVK